MKAWICLITPGHLSSDPRLIKEATALSKHGYAVHLIFTQYVPELVVFDERILQANPEWTFDVLDWTSVSRKGRFRRMISGVRRRMSSAPELRVNRNFVWQLNKAIMVRADLYIAHNLGALPVAVAAARKNKSKSGFDAEDLHRYETSDDDQDSLVRTKIAVESKYIPQLDYCTASSQGIANAYRHFFPQIRPLCILNTFPRCEGVGLPDTATKLPLKLFWFSQTIGLNRGLQDAVSAIASL